MDHFAEVIEHNDDEEFDRLNSDRVGERYPGGPVWTSKGKRFRACMPVLPAAE